MPRRYVIPFEKISCSVAQDLISVKGPTGARVCRIIRAQVSDVDLTAPTNTMINLRCRLATATITLGSVGAAGVINPLDLGDAAASFTARTNDTTKATTSGAFSIIEELGVNVFAGWDFMFPSPPIIGLNEGFVFELLTSPTAVLLLSGSLTVEELGG